jgi:RecA/RadA recombinase
MAFDMQAIADTLKKKLSKTDPDLANAINIGSNLSDPKNGQCIQMPDWWQEATGTKGIYCGRITMIAGDSDSGKTSAAIVAMKAAQEQGYGIIYVETENKTTTRDLESWGVDTNQIVLVQKQIAEVAFEAMFQAIDTFFGKYPTEKLLVVFDSIGNTVSFRDSEIDLTKDSQQPGAKGKINRIGLNKMVLKRDQGNVAFLIINYTYDNIGSHGKTNAGGKAVNFFSSLTYQTQRVKWLEKTVDGNKVRKGAIVKWQLFKNHIDKENPGRKDFMLQITADGIKLVEGADGD